MLCRGDAGDRQYRPWGCYHADSPKTVLGIRIASLTAMDQAKYLSTISAEVTLKHLAFITHAVPAERVSRHLPDDFKLETFKNVEGRERALITTGCFLNEDLRWPVIPRWSLSFPQITYRTYVRYGNRVGAYFLGTDVGSGRGYLLQRSIARNVAWAKIDMRASRSKAGYRRYHCLARSVHGVTEFKLTAAHRAAQQDQKNIVQRITYRLHGFFESSAGVQADQFVQHKRMLPYSGDLLSGRFEFWERMGILKREEAEDAFSVLVQPSIKFQVFPAVPVQLLPEAPVYRGKLAG